MFENFRSKFAIVEIGIVYHDHLAIRSNVFASNLDWTLVVTQSWWLILYAFTTKESVDIINGIVIDHAPIEPIAFDQRCWRSEWLNVVIICCEYGRGIDEHYEY